MTNELPTFNYELLQGLEVGTEEFGVANTKMFCDWIANAIEWCLINHNQGIKNGDIPEGTGCPPDRLRYSLEGMVGLVDKDAEGFLLSEAGDSTVLDALLPSVLKYLVSEGHITYLKDQNAFLTNNPVDASPNPHDKVVDGVEYPVVTSMSPTKTLYFAENPSVFTALYPKGKFNNIVATARHLREGQVTATEHSVGGSTNWFYTFDA